MEMAEIRCGRCGGLMAVPTGFLGRQVRCPGCREVVLAPAPEVAAVPAAAADSGREHSGSLGENGLTPQAEESGGLGTPGTANGPPAEAPAALAGGTAVFGEYALTALGDEATAPATSAWPEQGAPPPQIVPSVSVQPEHFARRQGRRTGGMGGWWFGLVVVPLFVYAVLATVAVYLLWERLQKAPPHPLEMFPDVEGDTPGVQKNGKKTSYKGQIAPETLKLLSDVPVPAQLRVALGETLRVGDLGVTPFRVERKVVRVFVEGYARPEPCPHESLVLHLRLRNASPDSAFTPLDNYFDRHWKAGRGAPPLTRLEIGPHRFYGGPAEWNPRGATANARRQWVEGRPDFDEAGLGPGGETDSFVCTDGSDGTVIEELERSRGKMLWRVEVRRGLVRVGSREVPAAAVIGVEFGADDVRLGAG